MTDSSRPPRRLAEWLRRALPTGVADDIVGDLVEEFVTTIEPDRGRVRATLWFVCEAVRSVASIWLRRAVGRYVPAPGRFGAPADPSIPGALREDTRQALAAIRRNPRFSAVAIGLFALAIAATTVGAAVLHGVLLAPLPFPEPDRLVQITGPFRAPGNVADLDEAEAGLEAVVAVDFQIVDWTRDADASRHYGYGITPGYAEVFGVEPRVGRWPTPDDPRAVVVLSHELWVSAMDRDPDVVGRALRLNGEAHTVIGVAPPRARPPTSSALNGDFFLPNTRVEEATASRSSLSQSIYGRLLPGTRPDAVASALNASLARLRATYADVPDRSTEVRLLRESIVGNDRSTVWLLTSAALLLLLLACVNAAHLFLARAEARIREFGVRTALGASRLRIGRQLLVEGLLLAGVGGSAGVLLAAAALTGVRAALANGVILAVGRADEIALSAPVVGAAIALTAAAGLVSAWVSAFDRTKGGSAGLLSTRTGSGPRGRARGFVIASQVALSMLLLIGCGLVGKSVWEAYRMDTGAAWKGVHTITVLPPLHLYPDGDSRRTVMDRLRNELRNAPEVQEVATITQPPFVVSRYGFWSVQVADDPDRRIDEVVELRNVSANYFDFLSIPLLRGRSFTPEEGLSGPFSEHDPQETAAILSEGVAARLFPDGDALGSVLQASDERLRVVGVAGDVAHFGPTRAPPLTIYQPDITPAFNVLVRIRSGSSVPVERVARRVVSSIDPAVPEPTVRALSTHFDRALGASRAILPILLVYTLLAASLSGLGIFGVVSYLTARQTHEIGVRLALGARPTGIQLLIVARSVRFGLAGAAVAYVVAYAVGSALDGVLFETDPFAPSIYAGSTALFLGVTALAAYVPARRASRRSLRETLGAE